MSLSSTWCKPIGTFHFGLSHLNSTNYDVTNLHRNYSRYVENDKMLLQINNKYNYAVFLFRA